MRNVNRKYQADWIREQYFHYENLSFFDLLAKSYVESYFFTKMMLYTTGLVLASLSFFNPMFFLLSSTLIASLFLLRSHHNSMLSRIDELTRDIKLTEDDLKTAQERNEEFSEHVQVLVKKNMDYAEELKAVKDKLEDTEEKLEQTFVQAADSCSKIVKSSIQIEHLSDELMDSIKDVSSQYKNLAEDMKKNTENIPLVSTGIERVLASEDIIHALCADTDRAYNRYVEEYGDVFLEFIEKTEAKLMRGQLFFIPPSSAANDVIIPISEQSYSSI